MATDKVVSAFRTDLRKLTESLDSSLSGLSLCMVFQQRSAPQPDKWTICVCADGLDEMSDRAAIAYIVRKIEEECTPETNSAIQRVLVLRSYDPAVTDLLRDVESEDDARLLIGRSVFDRVIERAQLFLVRDIKHLSASHERSVA